METEKITVRLPVHLIRAVDTFIRMGEFGSRSEAIRRALKKYIEELMLDAAEKAEFWTKLQELQIFAEEVDKLKKK